LTATLTATALTTGAHQLAESLPHRVQVGVRVHREGELHIGLPSDGPADVRRHAQIHQHRDDGVPHVVNPDAREAGLLQYKGAKCRLRLRGSIGVPTSDGKLRS